MIVDLPYPSPPLWPNKPGHWAAKARERKKHKKWAYHAALAEWRSQATAGQVTVHILVYPKPTGPHPDKDNVVASAKAYIDGIALAIGIDDKHFSAPTVSFSRERKSRFIFEIGLADAD